MRHVLEMEDSAYIIDNDYRDEIIFRWESGDDDLIDYSYVEDSDGSILYEATMYEIPGDDDSTLLASGIVRIEEGDDRDEEEIYAQCRANIEQAMSDWLGY